MTSGTHTPEGLAIQKRDWKFGRNDAPARWWHSGDAGRTAFFNALSSTFPLGEKFFVVSVKHYRDGTPESLRSQIDDFVYQESIHSREHMFFNRQVVDAGYDMAPLEGRTRRSVEWASSRSPIHQLAATCALEHFTATLARAVLKGGRHLDGASEEARRMWRWHAVEEIEHKAVAFDTFVHVTQGMSRLRRWFMRSAVMVAAGTRFHWVLFHNIADLLRQDGRNNLRTWLRLLGYLYGRPGALRILLAGTFGYFRPGFHPWQEDDRPLLVRALETLAPPGGPQPEGAA